MKNLCIIQIVSSKPINLYGTTQLRCLQPAEYLRAYGYQVKVDHVYEANPIKGGIIFVHRVKLDKFTDAFLSLARVRGNVIIYDSDDLIYRINSGINTTTRFKNFNKLALSCGKAMIKCDVVTVATDYLANKAREFHKDVRVVRNALSKDFSFHARSVYEKRQCKDSDNVTIGYLSGSQHHDRDFLLVENTLIRLLKERDDVKVLLAGKLSFSEEFYSFGGRFIYHKFLPYSELVALYREVDINLIPLEVEDEFCQGRSELKYIEAGACGVVSVASATDTYKRIVTSGVNGVLIESNEWYEVLLRLINSSQFRKELGESAHKNVIEKYSFDIRAKELNEMLQDIRLKYLSRFKNKLSPYDEFVGCLKLAQIRFFRKLKQGVRSQILKYKLQGSFLKRSSLSS